MLIHLLACCFFVYAFKELFALRDLDVLSAIIDRKPLQNVGWSRISNFMIGLRLSGVVGLIMGFVISIIISIKMRWYWVNSVIVFLAVALLMRFGVLYWSAFRYVIYAPGELFKHNMVLKFIANGSVLLTIGALLFFLRISIKFINSKRSTD